MELLGLSSRTLATLLLSQLHNEAKSEVDEDIQDEERSTQTRSSNRFHSSQGMDMLENGSQQVEDLGNHDDWEDMHDLAVVLLNHQESVSTL